MVEPILTIQRYDNDVIDKYSFTIDTFSNSIELNSTLGQPYSDIFDVRKWSHKWYKKNEMIRFRIDTLGSQYQNVIIISLSNWKLILILEPFPSCK